MATIFLFVVMGLALRQKSFHQMDRWARLESVRRFLGSRRRLVVSRTTLWRVLPAMDRAALREFVQEHYIAWKQKAPVAFTLPSGRQIRMGIVDGSKFGHVYASCLQVKGDGGEFFLDVELWPGEGKELASSEGLLERVVRRHGRSFVELIACDGLYMNAPFLTQMRGHGLQVLVKIKHREEKRLNLLADARAIFDSEETRDGVEIAEGTDPSRGVSDRVEAAPGFQHAGYAGTLKVARVVEKRIKKGGRVPEPFWIVTSDESLKAQDLRELAHQRWSVENQGFKMLNEQLNSKHVWTRGKKFRETFEALILLMFLAFALVKAFQRSLDEPCLWQTYRVRRLTLQALATTLTDALERGPTLLSTA
jgi:hypothetical protein